MSRNVIDEFTHNHGPSNLGEVSDPRLIWSVILNLVLTVVEVVIGVLSGSLMLLADALHNFNDCGALVMAFVARRIARRSPPGLVPRVEWHSKTASVSGSPGPDPLATIPISPDPYPSPF